VTDTGVQLGQIGAWFNPRYDDDTRTEFVIQAERLGYPTAWLGGGRASISDLSLVERVLDETATITVATAIVNMWTNDPADIAESYQRIAARHGDRFLLGIGIGHPESITTYRQPYATMVDYLDQLDAGGVPRDRRILAALGPARASAGGRPHARDPPVPQPPAAIGRTDSVSPGSFQLAAVFDDYRSAGSDA
jgi:probable F420-dependent oxidoreductase